MSVSVLLYLCLLSEIFFSHLDSFEISGDMPTPSHVLSPHLVSFVILSFYPIADFGPDLGLSGIPTVVEPNGP